MAHFVIPSRRTRQPQGCIGAWALDTPGIALDSSPSSRNLTLSGSIASPAIGKRGLAQQFSGSTAELVRLPIDGVGRSALTISIWIYPTLNSGGYQFAVDESATVSLGIYAGQYRWSVVYGPGLSIAENVGTVDFNAWQHMVWRYTGTSAQLIKNGSTVVSNAGSLSGNLSDDTYTDGALYLGGFRQNSTNYYPWNGSLSQLQIFDRAISDAEVVELYRTGFAAPPRRLYFGASGGGATTTTIEPSKGSLAVAGYAPGITQPRTIAPSKGAATLTGYAPGIEQDKSVAPAKGALTLTGYVPTLTQPRTIAAVKGALTLAGYAPGISQSASGTIAPSAGALLLTGHAPGLEQDRNVAPSVGHLTLTGGQPGIVQNVTTFIAPSVGALALLGYTPDVTTTANQAIAPTQGALLLGGYAPVLAQTGAQIIGPIKGALTLAGYAPTVQVIGAGVTVVEPSQGALSLSGYAPLIGVILAADAPDSTRLIDRDSARIGTNVPSWRRPRLG